MVRIIGNERVGKTRRLIEECIKHNGTIVCKNARAMEVKIKDYGFDKVPACIGYDTFLRDYDFYISANDKFYIDELENMFEEKVAGYTLTNEPLKEN